MRRKLLIGILALGTVLGYGAFFARLACHARGGPGYAGWGGWRGGDRREMFERHVAELCTDAALRTRSREGSLSNVPSVPNVIVVPGVNAAAPALAPPQPPPPGPPPPPPAP